MSDYDDPRSPLYYHSRGLPTPEPELPEAVQEALTMLREAGYLGTAPRLEATVRSLTERAEEAYQAGLTKGRCEADRDLLTDAERESEPDPDAIDDLLNCLRFTRDCHVEGTDRWHQWNNRALVVEGLVSLTLSLAEENVDLRDRSEDLEDTIN